jgi:hypothetical protein
MGLIEKLADFIAAFFASGNDTRALVSFLELIILAIMLAVAASFKSIILFIPYVRGFLNYGEKYAGQYLQIINSGQERRYSLINIRYSSRKSSYLLRGIQYDTKGQRAIDFKSVNVDFIENPLPYFEFVWFAETVTDAARFDGYTQMRPDTMNANDMEGRGFSITFDKVPRRFDLRFIKLTRKRLAAFKLIAPKTEKDRIQFIKDFHKQLQKHPDLQPTEEASKPLY